jgi:uncharacterized membrane protein YwzB
MKKINDIFIKYPLLAIVAGLVTISLHFMLSCFICRFLPSSLEGDTWWWVIPICIIVFVIWIGATVFTIQQIKYKYL